MSIIAVPDVHVILRPHVGSVLVVLHVLLDVSPAAGWSRRRGTRDPPAAGCRSPRRGSRHSSLWRGFPGRDAGFVRRYLTATNVGENEFLLSFEDWMNAFKTLFTNTVKNHKCHCEQGFSEDIILPRRWLYVQQGGVVSSPPVDPSSARPPAASVSRWTRCVSHSGASDAVPPIPAAPLVSTETVIRKTAT